MADAAATFLVARKPDPESKVVERKTLEDLVKSLVPRIAAILAAAAAASYSPGTPYPGAALGSSARVT